MGSLCVLSKFPTSIPRRKDNILTETVEWRILRDFVEHKVENAVQIHKQLAENENIHVCLEYIRNTLRGNSTERKKLNSTTNQQQLHLNFA